MKTSFADALQSMTDYDALVERARIVAADDFRNSATLPMWDSEPVTKAEVRRIAAALTDEREACVRLKGALQYIHTQAKSRPSGDAMTLSVIERNASAALDSGFQKLVAKTAAIRSRASEDKR